MCFQHRYTINFPIYTSMLTYRKIAVSLPAWSGKHIKFSILYLKIPLVRSWKDYYSDSPDSSKSKSVWYQRRFLDATQLYFHQPFPSATGIIVHAYQTIAKCNVVVGNQQFQGPDDVHRCWDRATEEEAIGRPVRSG